MNAAEVQRYARYTAECYSNPTQFSGPEEYLTALSEVLDELCVAVGVEPPAIEDAWPKSEPPMAVAS